MTYDLPHNQLQQLIFSYTQNRANHEVQLYTLITSQQPMKTHHLLVRRCPDTLLAYLTLL